MFMHSETGELRKTLESNSTPVEPNVQNVAIAAKGSGKATAMETQPAESQEMDEEEKAKYVKIRHGAGI